MKVEGRRTSANVEDRRGNKAAVGGAVGGVSIIAILIFFLSNGQVNLMDTSAQQQQACQPGQECSVSEHRKANDGQPYANGEFKDEDDLKNFASIILASTEDIWSDVFQKNGKVYKVPKMVVFSDAVDTGCGHADYNVGPFYCSADMALYIDLSFLANMKKQLGAGGDFAYAYVIAHEVGHHVQYILGDLTAHNRQEQMLRKQNRADEANLISVQTELQADYYAGVWAHYESKRFGSIDQNDIAKAINAAKAVGDDNLGIKRRENFSHGSSEMRVKWLYKGLKTGDMNGANTFDYNSLNALENVNITGL